MKNKINIIFGATASGKTKLGIDLAKKLDGVVVNYDSMQIYKEIPIITAQPSESEKDGVEHLLFGHISCDQKYSVGKWLGEAVPLIKEIINNKKTPILVGGTGMYIKTLMDGLPAIPDISLDIKSKVSSWKKVLTTKELHDKLEEYDPAIAGKLNINDSQRIQRALEVFLQTGKSLLVWQKEDNATYFPNEIFNIIKVEKPREVIYENIDKRFLQMIEMGVVDEVRAVYNKYGNVGYPKACGLYEIISYLNGDITLNEAIARSQQISRNYAKRQITWMNHQVVEGNNS